MNKDLFNSKKNAVTIKGRKVLIRVNNTKPYNLKIFNMRGRVCWQPNTSQSTKQYTWQPNGTGMYIVYLESGKDIYTRRLTIVK